MKGKFRFFIPWPVVLLWLFLPSSLHAADSLKVAAIFPKTGQAVVVSGLRPEFSAIQLAIKELNDGGGILGHPLEVLEYDNQSSALGSKNAALFRQSRTRLLPFSAQIGVRTP